MKHGHNSVRLLADNIPNYSSYQLPISKVLRLIDYQGRDTRA